MSYYMHSHPSSWVVKVFCIALWYSNDKQGFSGEVCFSHFRSLHRYCTLIYNASLALHYAACDCHSSDFPLLLLPYVFLFSFYFCLFCLPSAFSTCSFNFSFFPPAFSSWCLLHSLLLLFFFSPLSFSSSSSSSFHPLPHVYTLPSRLLSSLYPPFISPCLSS